MRVEENLLRDEVRVQVPDPLTQRVLLIQVPGLYNPLSLATPVKQKVAILVKRTFHEAKVNYSPLEDKWEAPLTEGLRKDAICLFEDDAKLSQLKLIRPLKPSVQCAKPCGITFSDGSERSYGAVLYLRWKLPEDVTIRLVV